MIERVNSKTKKKKKEKKIASNQPANLPKYHESDVAKLVNLKVTTFIWWIYNKADYR